MMYLIHDVEMPNIISMILQSSDPELLEAFFYEFLSDFDDLKFEYKDNGDDSESKWIRKHRPSLAFLIGSFS